MLGPRAIYPFAQINVLGYGCQDRYRGSRRHKGKQPANHPPNGRVPMPSSGFIQVEVLVTIGIAIRFVGGNASASVTDLYDVPQVVKLEWFKWFSCLKVWRPIVSSHASILLDPLYSIH